MAKIHLPVRGLILAFVPALDTYIDSRGLADIPAHLNRQKKYRQAAGGKKETGTVWK
ncbi:MAG: hypothetical protein ACM3UZ_06405 [Acidobacteriota bacterium]